MTTIKKCSRIVVLHKGAVVEDGTYEELSQKKDGHFARLEQGVAWDETIKEVISQVCLFWKQISI